MLCSGIYTAQQRDFAKTGPLMTRHDASNASCLVLMVMQRGRTCVHLIPFSPQQSHLAKTSH